MKSYDSSVFIGLNQNDIDLRTFLQKIPNLTATLPEIGCLLRRLFSFSTPQTTEDNIAVLVCDGGYLCHCVECRIFWRIMYRRCPTRYHTCIHTRWWSYVRRFHSILCLCRKRMKANTSLYAIGLCAVALLSQQFFTLATPKWKLILRGLCKMPLYFPYRIALGKQANVPHSGEVIYLTLNLVQTVWRSFIWGYWEFHGFLCGMLKRRSLHRVLIN